MGALFLAFLALGAGAAELSVRIDPRLELASLSALAGSPSPPLPTGCPAIDEYRRHAFARYAGEQRLQENRGAEPALGSVLVRLSAPPELAEIFPLPPSAVDAFGGRRGLRERLDGLRGLGRELRFEKFHADAVSRRAPELARLKAELLRLGALESIERYTGLALNGRLTVMTPALDPALDVPVLIETAPDGSRELAWTIGFCPPADASAARGEVSRVIVSVWHEALHGVLDPFADLHGRKLAALSRWDVREHIVQAATLRVLALERHRLEGIEPSGNTRPGLDPAVMTALGRSFERYEAERSGRSLAEFYPELLDAFPSSGRTAAPAPGDWLVELVEPFPTDGARRAAVERIGLSLKRREDPELRLRRGALRWLLGDAAGALEDARGHALEGVIALDLGETSRGLGLLRSSSEACREASLFCADLRWWIEPRRAAARAFAKPVPAGAIPDCRAVTECRGTAIRLFGERRLEAALLALEKASALDPDDADVLMDRGAVLHELGRADEALKNYDRALTLTGAATDLGSRWMRGAARAARASVFQSQGDALRSRDELAAALAAAGKDWALRSSVEMQLKRHKRALAAY